MAKDNAALTRELAQVTADLAEISRRLNMFTPEVNDKLIAVETKATRVENKLVEIDDKLERYLTPLVEATLPGELASTDSKIEELVKVVQEVKASEAALGDAANAATGRLDAQATEMSPIKMSMASVEPTIRQAKEDIQKMRDEVTRNHQIGETRYAEQQGQLAVMQMQQGGGQTGSGPRSTDPLVTHKLIIGKDKITGDEEFTVIDSWIKELETDLEIILPGAKAIMVQAQTSQHIIDSPQLLSHANAALATKVSRELYVSFTKKRPSSTRKHDSRYRTSKRFASSGSTSARERDKGFKTSMKLEQHCQRSRNPICRISVDFSDDGKPRSISSRRSTRATLWECSSAGT